MNAAAPKDPGLRVVGGTDHDARLARYFALNQATRKELEACTTKIRRALVQAQKALDMTEEDTNAEIEVQDIIDCLQEALERVSSTLAPEED